jgi:hypothetical protein
MKFKMMMIAILKFFVIVSKNKSFILMIVTLNVYNLVGAFETVFVVFVDSFQIIINLTNQNLRKIIKNRI